MIHLWTYFTPCSSVSIVNFEQVNAAWVAEQVSASFYAYLPGIYYIQSQQW